MKKQFLMFMAIVILALPLKANTITTQPCEEETITSIVSQTEDILSCLETLTTEERGAYYETAAFDEFKKLLVNNAGKISKLAKKSMNFCDLLLMENLNACAAAYTRPEDLDNYYLCVREAYYLHERCIAP